MLERKCLKPEEVEQVYGIKVRTLESWRRDGRGPRYSKCGKYCFYLIEDLDAFIASNMVKTVN